MDMAVLGRLFFNDITNMAQRVTFYIDGFNFYYGLRRTKRNEPQWADYYWINMVKLCQGFLGEGQEVEKVIYFTASPLNPEKRIKVYFPPSNFSCDLKDNLIHHSSKPVLMYKNERRFRDAIMPNVVTDGTKRYEVPEKWRPANIVR